MSRRCYRYIIPEQVFTFGVDEDGENSDNVTIKSIQNIFGSPKVHKFTNNFTPFIKFFV